MGLKRALPSAENHWTSHAAAPAVHSTGREHPFRSVGKRNVFFDTEFDREAPMVIEQVRWTQAGGWGPHAPGRMRVAPQLVLVFGGETMLLGGPPLDDVRRAYPAARILGCSTAGEICDTRVADETLVATAVHFEHARVEGALLPIGSDSSAAGRRLAAALPPEGLRHAFVLADGLTVNGTEFAHGLRAGLPAHVAVTGGLAGDGNRFQHTTVVMDGEAGSGNAAILGFYGERLAVGHGCMGGWGAFGPERLITRSSGRVLYELDGQPVLALYQKYLGEHASGLPGTGLMFPLVLRTPDGAQGVARVVLGIDEAVQSVTFAGDMPEGAYARLMMASPERLLEGAAGAARAALEGVGAQEPGLALLVSCTGRKLVLEKRIGEEVEAVRETLGTHPALAGFYSYGEIAPLATGAGLELQNQTMVVTTFAER